MRRLLPTLDTTSGGEEATGEMGCLFRQFQGLKLRPRRPSSLRASTMAGSVRAPPTHPMDWEAGAVAGCREVGGGERWRSVGDEDRHAAFFLTIADEKNKPEFCKSDPRRRQGWGWGGELASPLASCRPPPSFCRALADPFWSRSPYQVPRVRGRAERQAGAPFSSTPFLPPIRSLTQHRLSQHIPCPRRGGVRER